MIMIMIKIITIEFDFSDLIDVSNLNVQRPFPQKSAGVGEEPFQTHSGKSYCASEMAPLLHPRIFAGRGAGRSNLENQ